MRPFWHFRFIPVFALLALALFVLFPKLRYDEADPGRFTSVRVEAPVTDDGGLGWFLRVSIRMTTCGDPVSVAVQIDANRDLWRTRAATLRKTSSMTLTVGGRVIDPRYRSPGDPGGALPEGDGRIAPSYDPSEGTPIADHRTVGEGNAEETILRVPVDEPFIGNGMRVTFQADWLQPRGLGTCWLHLPSLIGSPDPTMNVVTLGSNQVDGGGEVVTETAFPPPSARRARSTDWDCAGEAHRQVAYQVAYHDPLGDPLSAPTGATVASTYKDAMSTRELRRELRIGGDTCEATVVVKDPSADFMRDLLLLTLGALVSIAAAEALVGIYRILAAYGLR